MNKLILVLFLLLFLVPTALAIEGSCQDKSFLERLFASPFQECHTANNLVCEDGENYLLDDDCTVTLRGVVDGSVLVQMWFLRVVLLILLVLFIRGSPAFPYGVIASLMLLVNAGAFSKGLVVGTSCMGPNFVLNAGFCVLPERPLLGWVIVLVVVLWLFSRHNRKV